MSIWQEDLFVKLTFRTRRLLEWNVRTSPYSLAFAFLTWWQTHYTAALHVLNRGHRVNSIRFLLPVLWFTCASHTKTNRRRKKKFFLNSPSLKITSFSAMESLTLSFSVCVMLADWQDAAVHSNHHVLIWCLLSIHRRGLGLGDIA